MIREDLTKKGLSEEVKTMNDYKAETIRKEADVFDELRAMKCEFDRLQKKLETIEKEKEFLQTDLNQANNEIRFLKGQIEAYQYALNCHR